VGAPRAANDWLSARQRNRSSLAVKNHEALGKDERLRRRPDYLHVQGTGAKVSSDSLIALALKNERSITRLGLTVSSKVGNAVVRNRIRRRLRELYRKR